MADIKWIKITTDMFDNRKIKHLRKLPEGNSIVLIWVMLLTMAGRCNSGGLIFLTENIPYTPKMLADELGFEENTVQLALKALEQFNMIVTDQGFFTIAGWEEYQNVEGMDKIREQTRMRVAAHREKQKLLACNVTGNVTVTDGNATEEEKELEGDKEIEKEKKKVRKKGAVESFDSLIDAYTPSEDLKNAITEFIKMRQRIRKPMTNYALSLMLKKLDKMATSADVKILILNQSIVNGWQDVYELKNQKRKGASANAEHVGAGSEYGQQNKNGLYYGEFL